MDLESIAANLKSGRDAAIASNPPAEPIKAPVETTAPVIANAEPPKEVPVKEVVKDVVVNKEPVKEIPVDKDKEPDSPAPIAQEDLDFLNSLNDEPAKGDDTNPSKDKKETDKTSTPVDYDDEKSNPYVSKAKEFDKLSSDPFFKSFLEFRKNGGENIKDFAKNLIGVDYDAMSPEEIYRKDIELLGVTQEAIDEEMEMFDNLSPIEKLRKTNPIKNALKKQQEESIKPISMPVNENAQRRAQAAQTAIPELNDTVSDMVGKKYSALTITPEMGEEITKYVMSRTHEKFDSNGDFIGYDIKESIDAAVYKLYKNKMFKAIADASAARAKDEAYKERQRPNNVNEPSGGAPRPTRDLGDALKGITNGKWKS